MKQSWLETALQFPDNVFKKKKVFCSEAAQNEQTKKFRISCELEDSQNLQLLSEMSSKL